MPDLLTRRPPLQNRRFPAPATLSAAARHFLDAAPPPEPVDLAPEALAARRRAIHAESAPGGRALAEALGVVVNEGEVAGMAVQWIAPARPAGNHTVLYLFGGGHITGSPDEDLAITARLAHFGGFRLCAPYYRLAPEHPFPAARDDAVAVWRALAGQPGRLALAGESAGANLALSLIGALAHRRLALPAALALLSPWCDLSHSGDTIATLDGIDPSLSHTHHLRHMAAAYAGGRALDDPEISPLFAGVPPGFPATIITTGTRDLLLSDCARLSEKLRRAGVPVELRLFEGMWHVFEYYPGLPEAEASTRGIADFLRLHLN